MNGWAWIKILCLGVLLWSPPVRKADAISFVTRWHEDAAGWLEEELEGLNQPYRTLDEPSLKRIFWALIAKSPVRWAECLLVNRPEFGGGPWRFFEWQKASLEYDGHVINKSAKGTGKTREIVALIFHSLICQQGSVLHAANSMVTRDEIFEELMYQREMSPLLAATFPDSKIRRGHPRRISGPVGNSARFLLANTGGKQLRSVHIGAGGYVLGDEAAVWPDDAFDEFFGRAEHGCRIRLYSVPDGRRDSRFFELADNAQPLESSRLDFDKPTCAEVGQLSRFALVHWERPDMPAPHWSEEAAALELAKYGSIDAPGYLQYVLGRDGDPVGVVFPWALLRQALVPLPDYRLLRCVFDLETRSVRTSIEVGVVGAADQLRRINSSVEDLETFTLRRWVDESLPDMPVDVIGMDCGRNEDPSEILVFEVLPSGGLRLRARIHLSFAPTDEQGDLVAALGRGDVFVKPRYGIGIEASGASHGQAVWDIATGKKGKLARSAVTAYDWRNQVDVVNEKTGRPQRDKNRHKVRRSLKETATVLLEELVGRQSKAGGYFELPRADADIRREWSSHASRKGATSRVFDDRNDHTIEAARAAVLRVAESRQGAGGAAATGRTGARRAAGGKRAALFEDRGRVRDFRRPRR